MPQVSTKSIARVSNHKNIFGVLDILPSNVSFKTQNKDERVFIKTRPHPLINIGWVSDLSILIVLPVIVSLVVINIPLDLSTFMPGSYTLFMIILIYYSILITYLIYNFVDWYYDIYLVTNERIINIEFSPLKKHRISEASLSNIEDVTESVIGLLPGVFNYGDVKVQTASSHDLFIFRAVPDPTWFRDVIMDLSKNLEQYENEP